MINSLSLAFLQGDAPLVPRDEHLLMICIAVIAAAMAIQACVILVAGLQAMKMLKEFKDLAHDLHGKTTPLLLKSNELMADLAPKIRTVTENATEISYTVRGKVDEAAEILTQVNRMVAETNAKTRVQVDHVDRMVTTALDTAEEVTTTVTQGIRGGVRQTAAVVVGVRTTLETLLKNFGYKGPQRGDETRL